MQDSGIPESFSVFMYEMIGAVYIMAIRWA